MFVPLPSGGKAGAAHQEHRGLVGRIIVSTSIIVGLTIIIAEAIVVSGDRNSSQSFRSTLAIACAARCYYTIAFQR